MEHKAQTYLIDQKLAQLRNEWKQPGADHRMLEIRAKIIGMGKERLEQKTESVQKVVEEIREEQQLESNVKEILV